MAQGRLVANSKVNRSVQAYKGYEKPLRGIPFYQAF